jgi:preprotein translocase subunit SecG
MWNVILPTLLFLTSVFLILLVLIQRGRGGGLAGAFGGLGGQSAFGTKAGDLFTRITIGVAAFWIILCAASVKLLNEGSQPLFDQGLGRSGATASPPAGGTPKASDAKTGAEQAAPAKTAPAPEAAGAKAGPTGTEQPAGATPATNAPASSPENAK